MSDVEAVLKIINEFDNSLPEVLFQKYLALYKAGKAASKKLEVYQPYNPYFDQKRFDNGEMPTITRCGRKVLKVINSGLDVPRPLIAWLEGGGVYEYCKDGRFYDSEHSNYESDLDLLHEPKVNKLEVIIYRETSAGEGVLASLTSHEFEFSEARRTKPRSFKEFKKQLKVEGELVWEFEIELPA